MKARDAVQRNNAIIGHGSVPLPRAAVPVCADIGEREQERRAGTKGVYASYPTVKVALQAPR